MKLRCCLLQTKDCSELMVRPCDGVTSFDDVTDDVSVTTMMTLMAVKQYEPQYFSHSGRVEQELTLNEGDIVHQLGTSLFSLTYE